MSDGQPNQWQEIQFSELCARLVNGGTPATSNQKYWIGETPWVTGADFDSRGISEIRRFLSLTGIRESSTSVVAKGNLLVVTRTGVGKLAIAPFDVAISQDITGIYPNTEIADTIFIYYLLAKEIVELKKLNQGTSINGIIRSDLERHVVTIPTDKSIQIRIAAILQTIDEAIEKTEALIEKYGLIKAGMMHDLFTRGLTPDGKLRPPRHQAPELYKKTPLGWLPKEWELSGLASKRRSGVSHLKTGPFGSSLKGEHWATDGHPVITIGSLGEGEFIASELLFVSNSDADRLSYFKLKRGDIVFSRVADVGRSVVIDDDQFDWIMSSNLMRIALDEKLVLPNFIQLQLAFDGRLKKQIRQKVNAGGRDVANSNILNSLLFVWPSLSEQREMVSVAGALDSRVRLERSKHEKLLLQKSGLMHDLLTGKVPVKVDQPEAAHV